MEELIETSEYILKEERIKDPDSDLTAYNGLFESTTGMCSIYEFMYSFRDKEDDPFPDLLSDNAIRALETIKKMKERISSGSCVGGSNVGINQSSSIELQKAAAEIIKFMTSKETQKEYILSSNVASGIMGLYDEDDVCDVLDCKLVKSIQFVNRPTHVNTDYDSYSALFRDHVFEYLYGNKTASQVLHEINDYTKIYKITLNTENTSLDLWFISLFGLMLILSSGFLEFGDLTKMKCQFKWIMVSFGITLNLIPILYKMIVKFPEQNKYSLWVHHNKYKFLCIFILIEFFIMGISFIKPYDIVLMNRLDENNLNFMKCIVNGGFGKFIQVLFILNKVIIFLIFLLLIFIEWNIKETQYDIRALTGAIYLDILDIIFLLIKQSLNYDNYIVEFLLNEIIIIIFVLSNYSLIYGYRVVLYFIIKDNEEDILKGSINKLNDNNSKKFASNPDMETNSGDISKKGSIINISKKIINYHYMKNAQSNSTIMTESAIKSNKFESTTNSENKV
ncbi:hypothetical protein PIROE2DRAFT_64281 [Piromyces sp. E2]|nr:hypothetical protein PIROE2DRAFT_64281 [Piromyces sp. E2]|eukprot:OUM58628.1 hypothetical protein PIROE2DRAFT_64281 [Piromyces sp. E2]